MHRINLNQGARYFSLSTLLLLSCAGTIQAQSPQVDKHRVSISPADFGEDGEKAYTRIFDLFNKALPEVDFTTEKVTLEIVNPEARREVSKYGVIFILKSRGVSYRDTLEFYQELDTERVEQLYLPGTDRFRFIHFSNCLEVVNKVLAGQNSCWRLYAENEKGGNWSFAGKNQTYVFHDFASFLRAKKQGDKSFRGHDPFFKYGACDLAQVAERLNAAGLETRAVSYRPAKKKRHVVEQVLLSSRFVCRSMEEMPAGTTYENRLDSLTGITGGEVQFDFLSYKVTTDSSAATLYYAINGESLSAEIDPRKTYDSKLDWSITPKIRNLGTGRKVMLIAYVSRPFAIGYLTEEQVKAIKTIDENIVLLQY